MTFIYCGICDIDWVGVVDTASGRSQSLAYPKLELNIIDTDRYLGDLVYIHNYGILPLSYQKYGKSTE